ncbi:DUF5067 domain-containing protein [Lederbergia graminis]|uniref:DUF5067 domain-containing protein n=1 Tax=Lederbergia graminis TaxID=735518 RepID=A0ABW0LL36_9BACI
MKKLFFLMSTLLLSLLVACGNDDSNDTSNNVNEQNDVEENSNNQEESKEQENNVEEDAKGQGVSDTGFDNGKYVYEIKEIEQITDKFGDVQILAVELAFTNNTDKPKSPWMSMGLFAEQETDVTVETLTGANGRFPDDYKPDLVKMGDADIKPGATVDAVIGFEIQFPGKPVRLYNFSVNDEKLFERIVETKE